MDNETSTKTRMIGELFENWLKALGKWFVKNTRLFFHRNCKAHPSAVISQLKSIKMVFRALNKTSKFQSLDQGIIYNFKIKYRTEAVKKCITESDEGVKSVANVLQAM